MKDDKNQTGTDTGGEKSKGGGERENGAAEPSKWWDAGKPKIAMEYEHVTT